jgi:hypothetical protein
MSRRAKSIQRAADQAPTGPLCTVEMVTAALRGRRLQAVTREGETAIVLDFGRHGQLTISASLDWRHERQTKSDLDVFERLDIGAVADLDLL